MQGPATRPEKSAGRCEITPPLYQCRGHVLETRLDCHLRDEGSIPSGSTTGAPNIAVKMLRRQRLHFLEIQGNAGRRCFVVFHYYSRHFLNNQRILRHAYRHNSKILIRDLPRDRFIPIPVMRLDLRQAVSRTLGH